MLHTYIHTLHAFFSGASPAPIQSLASGTLPPRCPSGIFESLPLGHSFKEDLTETNLMFKSKDILHTYIFAYYTIVHNRTMVRCLF